MTDQQFRDLVDTIARRLPVAIGYAFVGIAFVLGWAQYFHLIK